MVNDCIIVTKINHNGEEYNICGVKAYKGKIFYITVAGHKSIELSRFGAPLNATWLADKLFLDSSAVCPELHTQLCSAVKQIMCN